MFQIYQITNTLTGQIYIGQTIGTLRKRLNAHFTKRGCIRLNNAMKKYGRENFTIHLITLCSTQEAADSVEIQLIEQFNTTENGYNIMGGGQGKRSWPQEARDRISAKLKGRPLSEETKRRMSEARKGVVISPETRRKQNITRTGSKRSDESRAKMRAARYAYLNGVK